MLISHLKDTYPEYSKGIDLRDLTEFYKQSKKRFDEDAEFKKRSQLEVVKLQSGDADCIKAWQILCDVSRIEFNDIYRRLDVKN
jgi:arginyl-tRNA synthetase